ncbi:hypothetical protein AURDEDRAFT_179676 [Auricularia subglabra TFB-10046 SS5]|nr:hypothetical protein AURDEDRAFT_179676 [Auricularia subglabra TFB-10046 SS5]
MSFAGSPLRQSRRVDQQTFMSGDGEHGSPPRGQHTRSIPLSFAYGAPDLSPPQSTSPPRPRAADSDQDSPDTSPAHEPAAVRYARLKQRNQAAHDPAPGTIVRPPVPSLVKDTSVNIASAFSQAAASSAMSYRRSADPADDSHASAAPRRLAVPPSRLQRINAKNKAAGRATVSPAGADSDGEDASYSANKSARAKSPFNMLTETVARAVSPIGSVIRAASPMAASVATYVLREGRGDDSADGSGFQSFTVPEAGTQHSRPSSKAAGNGSYATNNSASYDYGQEEEMVAEMEADSVAKRNQAKRRAGRASLDDKAYKPTRSDNEASDEEFTDEDTGKRRRRKKKKDSGHLTLPTIGYDKNKKKKPTSKRRGKGLLDDDAASGSDRGSVAPRSVRGSVPPVVREPEPEPDDSQLEDTSGRDYEIHDDSAQLSYEEPPQPNGYAHLEAQTAPPRPRARWFGHALGAVVRAIYDLLSSVLFFIGKLLGMLLLLAYTALSSVWRIAVQTPYDWVTATSRSMSGSLPSILQLVLGLGVLYLAYFALSGSSTTSNSRGLFSSLFGGSRSPVYVAPDIPASNVRDVIERLRVVEAALDQTSQQLKRVVGRSDDLAAKLVAAQAQVETETRRASEAEEKLRGVTQRGIADMKVEVASIKEAITHAVEGSEALTQLEQRVASAEADVKHLKSAPATVVQPSAPAWWNNVKPGAKPVTIRASDGTDVTGFIGNLVERAVGRLQRDSVGRADYAQLSAGGRVVPKLTTPTLAAHPSNWRRRVAGWVTGYGYAQGHPPVMALHHDITLGHCWPFDGHEGSLGVLLARPVVVDAVTVDHVPRELAFESGANRAAPRMMEVWGLVDGADNRAKVLAFLQAQDEQHAKAAAAAEERGLPPPPPLYETLEKQRTGAYVRLGSFEYDINSPQHIQTFPVRPEVVALEIDFGIVVLRIRDNWGHPDFTCLYRFRVHGAEHVPQQISS